MSKRIILSIFLAIFTSLCYAQEVYFQGQNEYKSAITYGEVYKDGKIHQTFKNSRDPYPLEPGNRTIYREQYFYKGMLITPFVTSDSLYVYEIDTSMKIAKTYKVYIGADSLGTRFTQAYTYHNFVILESTNGGKRNYGAVSVINFETGSVKRIYDYESNKNYRKYVVEGAFITLPSLLYNIESDSSTLGSYALTGEKSSGNMFHGVTYPNVNAGYVNKACYDSFSVLEYGRNGNINYKRVGSEDCEGFLSGNFPRPMIAAFDDRFVVFEKGVYYFYKATCGASGTWHSERYAITTSQWVNLTRTPIVVPYDSSHFYLYQFRDREASFWSYEKGLIRSYKFPETMNAGTIDLLAPIGQRDTLVQANVSRNSLVLVDTTNKQVVPKGTQSTWPEKDPIQLLFYPDIKLIVSVNSLGRCMFYEYNNNSVNIFGSGIDGIALGRYGGNFKYVRNNEITNYSLSTLTSTSTGKKANFPFSSLVDIHITQKGESYLLFDAGGDDNFGGILRFIASKDSFEVITQFKGGFEVERAMRLSVSDSTISITAKSGGGLNSGGSVWTLSLTNKALTKIYYTPGSSAEVHGNAIKLDSLLYYVSKKPVIGHYNSDFVLHQANLYSQVAKEIPLDYITLNRTLRSFQSVYKEECKDPSGLKVSSITPSTVQIDWTTVTNAIKYYVKYKPIGGGTWSTDSTSTNSINLSALQDSTTYTYEVRSRCSSELSDWTKGGNFTTDKTSSVNKFEATYNLIIKPNPNRGSFEIEGHATWSKGFTLKVLDLRGKVVYSEHDRSVVGEFKRVINLERPISGIYYLQIANDRGISNRKIIIL
jgi:hypothetical protein